MSKVSSLYILDKHVFNPPSGLKTSHPSPVTSSYMTYCFIAVLNFLTLPHCSALLPMNCATLYTSFGAGFILAPQFPLHCTIQIVVVQYFYDSWTVLDDQKTSGNHRGCWCSRRPVIDSKKLLSTGASHTSFYSTLLVCYVLCSIIVP